MMLSPHAMPPPVDRPNCSHCASALQHPHHGTFDMTCLGCVARDLAQSPAAWRARKGDDREGLASAIRKVWGDDYATGRQAVWRWVQHYEARRQSR